MSDLCVYLVVGESGVVHVGMDEGFARRRAQLFGAVVAAIPVVGDYREPAGGAGRPAVGDPAGRNPLIRLLGAGRPRCGAVARHPDSETSFICTRSPHGDDVPHVRYATLDELVYYPADRDLVERSDLEMCYRECERLEAALRGLEGPEVDRLPHHRRCRTPKPLYDATNEVER